MYPFDQDPQENTRIVNDVWRSINHFSGVKEMPPPGSNIPKLNFESIRRLRAWIAGGAQDSQGTKHLSDSQIISILTK